MNEEILNKINIIGKRLDVWNDDNPIPQQPKRQSAVTDQEVMQKIDLLGIGLGVFKTVQIAAVMRRKHTNKKDGSVVDIIDMYPPWNSSGTYGRMKAVHEYLDHDWQTKRFEDYSGLKVDDIPVYDGQTAFVRPNPGGCHASERLCNYYLLTLMPQTDGEKTRIKEYYSAADFEGENSVPNQVNSATPSDNDLLNTVKRGYWNLLLKVEQEVFKGGSILDFVPDKELGLKYLKTLWGDRPNSDLKEGDKFIVGHRRVCLFRAVLWVFDNEGDENVLLITAADYLKRWLNE